LKDNLVSVIIGNKPTLIVLDKNIPLEKREEIKEYCKNKKINCVFYELCGGESIKTRENSDKIVDLIIAHKLKQVVAIGGGTILDVAGFAAAQARRGLPIIRIPTTLLSQCNIGATRKVGVNYNRTKNVLGFFHSPKAVITDTKFLETTPKKHNRSGIGEMIKAALVSNPGLFNMLEEHFQELVEGNYFAKLDDIVYSSLVEHLKHQAADPNDVKNKQGIRLGHALAHPFEEVTKGQLAHGEAVALDILISSYIAYKRQMLCDDDFDRIVSLHLEVGLPVYRQEITQDIVSKGFKKVMNRRSEIVVPVSIGNVDFIGMPTDDEINGSLEFLKTLDKSNASKSIGKPSNIADLI